MAAPEAASSFDAGTSNTAAYTQDPERRYSEQDERWSSRDLHELQEKDVLNVATCSNGGSIQRKKPAKRKDESLSSILRVAIVEHQLGMFRILVPAVNHQLIMYRPVDQLPPAATLHSPSLPTFKIANLSILYPLLS